MLLSVPPCKMLLDSVCIVPLSVSDLHPSFSPTRYDGFALCVYRLVPHRLSDMHDSVSLLSA